MFSFVINDNIGRTQTVQNKTWDVLTLKGVSDKTSENE